MQKERDKRPFKASASGARCEFCWPKSGELGEWINGKRYGARALQRLHWFNQFSPTSLAPHLREQGFDVETINGVLSWYETTAQALHDRRAEALPNEKLRRWSLFAEECKTPAELEALATECLSPGAQLSVAVISRLWQRALAGGHVGGTDLVGALKLRELSVPLKPSES